MKNDIIAWISRNYRKFLLWSGIAILVILSIASIAFIMEVIRLPPDDPIFTNIAGDAAKLEVIKLIGWGMSGIAVVWSIFGILHRAAALDKQNAISEKGHIQDRFKAATEHLGNRESISTRIAAFYEFYRLAKIESELDLREPIFDILCAHLRQITKDKNYQKLATQGSTEIKPTEEVQSLLKVLFKPYNKDKFIFVGIVADLEGAYLQGAYLQKTNLQEANLQEANLQEANLQEANLQEANLQMAYLQEANLRRADLQKTNLQEANLQEANLQEANLQEANLRRADMRRADLRKADLRKADLQEVSLLYANLQGANLQRANLQEVSLLYANLQGANLQGATTNKNNTIMPNGWENVVEKDENGETGVIFV